MIGRFCLFILSLERLPCSSCDLFPRASSKIALGVIHKLYEQKGVVFQISMFPTQVSIFSKIVDQSHT